MRSRKLNPHSVIVVHMFLWLGAVVGYFGAWVTRQPYSAALSWNAYELFDLLRLLPEIETGAISVNLHTFRLPILGLAVMLPLLLSTHDLPNTTKRILRGSVTLIAGVLCVLTLPPYPEILSAWRTPGWRVAFWWAILAGITVLVLTWLPPKNQRIRNWTAISVVLLTGMPALITRQRLNPALVNLHNAPVQWGFGLWLWLSSVCILVMWLWIVLIFSGNSSVNR